MTDDAQMHRSIFKNTFSQLKIPHTILAEAENGRNLVQLFSEHRSKGVDYIFCDIRMPVMDGLSALVKIRSIDPNVKMIMVSSEDVQRMVMVNQSRGDQEKAATDTKLKFEMLDKVATRVKGDVTEPGKINSILEACEKLALDPMLVAKHYGAKGYLHKPYDIARMKQLFEMLPREAFAQLA
jgi:CheY-like chemotaxis protein